MARDESNREDLLREATALVERIELVPRATAAAVSVNLARDVPIIVGFRADGALSIFFGADPVYQFNPAGELRRAYGNGLLFKALRGRLVSLTRIRGDQQVQLVRHELTDAERDDFLAQMTKRLRELAALLAADDFIVSGQVPRDADVLHRVRQWLVGREDWPIAARPNA